MGLTQKKYHITDDGKIFLVMNDGSVSEIGNVSSLLDNNKNVEKKKQPKSSKWMWTAMFSWIILIVACITFLVIHDTSTDFIRHLNYINLDLEQKLTQVQSELSSKSAELDSIHLQIRTEKQNRIPITVTEVQFANENQYSQIIDIYGSELYSSRICYLKPRITYIGRKTGTYNLVEKIYAPDGSLWHGTGSPENGTDSFTIHSNKGIMAHADIIGRGNKEPGCYYAGSWKFEVWYDNEKIYSQQFTI